MSEASAIKPQPAVADQFRGDVAVGEQQAGRQAERCGAGEARRYGDQQHRAAGAGREPDDDADDRWMLIGCRRPGERERKQRQSRERQDDGELLAPREPGRVPARRRERQDGDPGRRHRLHQRERREPQRRRCSWLTWCPISAWVRLIAAVASVPPSARATRGTSSASSARSCASSWPSSRSSSVRTGARSRSRAGQPVRHRSDLLDRRRHGVVLGPQPERGGDVGGRHRVPGA